MSSSLAIAADRRGSILLPGMAMGMILTMISLQVIEVARPILYRSLGQNAADAVALEGAVWHAQGMNLIALINVVMAAIFSILVAIRVAEILLIGAIAILSIAAAVASFFSFGTAGSATSALIRQLTESLIKVQRYEDKVSNPIIKTLTRAADAERTLAAVMPYVALAHPVTLSNDVPGIPFSFSLMPVVFEQTFSKFPNIPELQGLQGDPGKGVKVPWRMQTFVGKDGKEHKFEGFEIESSFPARMGTLVPPWLLDRAVGKIAPKLPKDDKQLVNRQLQLVLGAAGSLPVQEEDFYQICGRSAELMTATLLHVLGGPAGLGQEGIDKVSAFAAVIVGSLPSLMCTPIKRIDDSVKANIDQSVASKCDDERKAADSWSDADQKKCEEDQRKKYNYQKGLDPESVKVGRLWGIIAAPKESPFLHVWAHAQIDSPLHVEPANANGEFRHVCDGDGDAAKRGCSENSMWSNGWYAKLVPVRSFIEELRQKIGDLFAGWFSRALGKSITGLFDNVLKHVNAKPLAQGQLNDALNRAFGTLIGPKAANGWWNRRLAGGEALRGLKQWSLNKRQGFPEYLH